MSQQSNTIFVFGSNEAGRHGRGAALYARKYFGAVYEQGVGLQGYSYAIPTKDRDLRSLSLDAIENYVKQFLLFAENHPELRFHLTAIGCGLAGYKPANIAPMFRNASKNVILPPEFQYIRE